MARRSVLLLVAVLIAAVGTAMIVLYVRGIDARATEGQELVEVLVATEPIAAGESIDVAQEGGKIQRTRINRAAVVDGALDSTRSVAGTVALGNIYPGEQIIRQKFGEMAAADTLAIPDDMVAISVSLNDPQRVAGFVNPGARVAIFATVEPELMKTDGTTITGPKYTSVLLEDVQVIGVGTTTTVEQTTTTEDGQQTTEEIPRTILTLAVGQEQAEQVIYASNYGQLAFALRTEKSSIKDNDGVTLEELIPEYVENLDPSIRQALRQGD